MDREKGRMPDGRVFVIHNINATTRYIHPNYDYVVGDGILSETGRVVIFELRPKQPDDPGFVARWDGGNRAIPDKIQYAVDIDIVGPSNAEQRRFRNDQNGYSGHHAHQPSDEQNTYEVYIKTPAGLVFDATISFNRQHGLVLPSTTGNVATLNTAKVKAGMLAKIKSAIVKLYQLTRSSVGLRG
jgi:hypothetical protein